MNRFESAHIAMVEQLRSRGITAPAVLSAFEKVDRREYVLPRYLQEAYADSPLPIDSGQTISQPYMVALMLETLRLKSTDRVLEVGTGSGYQTALLAEMVDRVVSLECVETLHKKSQKKLSARYSNVECIWGDGAQGHPRLAPYDKIVVSAAAPEVCQPWLDQLKVGGLISVPVGTLDQNLFLLAKKQDPHTGEVGVEETRICGVRFVPLVKA